MLKRVLTTIALFGALLFSALAPSVAAENTTPSAQLIPASINADSARQSMTPVPGRKAEVPLMDQLKNPKLTQALGWTCTNGTLWCRPGYPGPLGGPCCVCGFCGWIIP